MPPASDAPPSREAAAAATRSRRRAATAPQREGGLARARGARGPARPRKAPREAPSRLRFCAFSSRPLRRRRRGRSRPSLRRGCPGLRAAFCCRNLCAPPASARRAAAGARDRRSQTRPRRRRRTSSCAGAHPERRRAAAQAVRERRGDRLGESAAARRLGSGSRGAWARATGPPGGRAALARRGWRAADAAGAGARQPGARATAPGSCRSSTTRTRSAWAARQTSKRPLRGGAPETRPLTCPVRLRARRRGARGSRRSSRRTPPGARRCAVSTNRLSRRARGHRTRGRARVQPGVRLGGQQLGWPVVHADAAAEPARRARGTGATLRFEIGRASTATARLGPRCCARASPRPRQPRRARSCTFLGSLGARRGDCAAKDQRHRAATAAAIRLRRAARARAGRSSPPGATPGAPRASARLAGELTRPRKHAPRLEEDPPSGPLFPATCAAGSRARACLLAFRRRGLRRRRRRR